MHALIIEDHKEIGEIYLMALRMMDIDGEHIVDGKMALHRLEQSVPDFIILDMNLPQVSGHYIYKNIRADSRLDKSPVIICTANTVLARALENELADGDIILVKPVSPQQLQEVVRGL